MITIPAASLAGAQIVQAGGANTNTTNSGQGTVTVTLPVSGNMVNAGGMVMVRPYSEVPGIFLPFSNVHKRVCLMVKVTERFDQIKDVTTFVFNFIFLFKYSLPFHII